jgi:acetoacetyl-CoA synthetase
MKAILPRRGSTSTTHCGCCSPPAPRGGRRGIVHGHGGILLEHTKALTLHNGLGSDDVFLWYTTPSWMVWNYLVSGLLTGSAIVCYDGSATYPGPDILWDLAARGQVTFLGTSPGHLAACAKARLHPRGDHDLDALRVIGSSGAPLPATANTWVAEQVGRRIQVMSISGGTDIVSAFAGSAPTLPVWPGSCPRLPGSRVGVVGCRRQPGPRSTG